MTLVSTQTEISLEIPTAEGISLSATYRTSGDSQIGAVLICPAMAVKARFYEPFARFLCDEGFHVLQIDYRGIAASQPESLRDCPATMQTWAEADISAALRWLKQKEPANPIAVVGHSAGGQLGCISNSGVVVDAMMVVASQSGYWRHWSGIRKLLMFFLWFVLIPVMSRLFGFFPARLFKLGEDLPRGVALQWAKWGRLRNYIASDTSLAARYSNYSGPILAYSFSDDEFAPAPAVKAFLSYFSSADTEHRFIEQQTISQKKIGHFGFFRERISRESLWTDSSLWLKSALTKYKD